MFFHQIELTTALRPLLLPDEILLFVQNGIGLYEGKVKLSEYQNGQAYLTSHRACYIDNAEPRRLSGAVDLKNVERYEFYAGFLKSSPKISFFPKPSKRASILGAGGATSSFPGTLTRTGTNGPPRSASPAPVATLANRATWICPICSLSNPVPENFDPATANAHTPLPPCLACGIKPPLVLVVKAAVNGMTNREARHGVVPQDWQQSLHMSTSGTDQPGVARPGAPLTTADALICPRCTFENHPSLLSCEICGASLISSTGGHSTSPLRTLSRSESPAPSIGNVYLTDDQLYCIKFSFRAGGEKIFYERLKGAMVQRKWLLHSAPPVPKPNLAPFGSNTSQSSLLLDQSPRQPPERNQAIGIAGLERRGLELRKNNEVVIGNAFEDLEALMTSAKEVIALAESFSSRANLGGEASTSEASTLLSESASALGLITTKDMLGSSSSSEAIYISELSRNLAEYLTDDVKGILRKEGGIMSLVDLWAVFNRARGGVELVSPMDFERAAQMWDKLRLPVRLRRFKSGLLVVQGHDRTDEKTIASMLAWLRQLHYEEPAADVTWDWRQFGLGVTVQETAERFGWSVAVASEELEMAEDKGVLCREQSLEGMRFWENWFERELGTQADSVSHSVRHLSI